MPPDLAIAHDFSLASCNTFGIDARARRYVRIASVADLAAALADPRLAGMPRLLLGGGSNIVLTGDFDGVVLHMAMKGREVVGGEGADGKTILVRACAEIREEFDPQDGPSRTPAGAIYISCAGRGGPHFGGPDAEMQIIQHALGDIPLVGMFAGGEIAHHHLYGYTGVLTVWA